MRRGGAMTGIPAPVGVADPVVERILTAIRERLEGDSGAARRMTNIETRLSAIDGGGSDGSIPIRPVAPQNLEATGIFGAIILTIDAIPAGGAYVEWLASPADDLSQSIVVGTSSVPIFQHYVGDDIGRYYWVRGVGYGQAALRGPLNATAGTYAASARDPSYLQGILEGNITADELRDLAVTARKIANGAIDLSGNKITGQLAGVSLADASVDTAKLGTLSVTAAKLADSSVTATKIGNAAVGTAAIANAAITNAKIGNVAIGTAQIANGAITAAKIGTAQVENAAIANAAITNALIANGAIDTANIRDAAITSAKIKTLAANKIVASTLSAITANLGTVNAGTFRTNAGSLGRVEMSSSGAFCLWAGSGSKSASNASFYVDTSGDMYARGDIQATSIKANSANIISTLMLQNNAVTVPMSVYFTQAQSINVDNWATAATLYVPSGTVPDVTPVVFSFGGYLDASTQNSAGPPTMNAQLRLVVDGSVQQTFNIGAQTVLTKNTSSNYTNYTRTLIDASSYSFITNLSSAAHTILLEYKIATDNDAGGTSRTISNCFITGVACKDAA